MITKDIIDNEITFQNEFDRRNIDLPDLDGVLRIKAKAIRDVRSLLADTEVYSATKFNPHHDEQGRFADSSSSDPLSLAGTDPELNWALSWGSIKGAANQIAKGAKPESSQFAKYAKDLMLKAKHGQSYDMLYRGVALSPDRVKDFLELYAPGKTIEVPLESFTEDRRWAAKFAASMLSEFHATQVIMSLKSAKGHPLKVTAQSEVLFSGKYLVDSVVKKGHNIIYIDLTADDNFEPEAVKSESK